MTETWDLEATAECNLCGAASFGTFTKKRGIRTGLEFQVVRCGDCGLIFVNPRLTEEENVRLYDEAYFNGGGFDPTVNYMVFDEEHEVRRDENRGILAKLDALRPGRAVRVLDVGCGTGALLRALDDAGYRDVSGLELSPYAAGVATERSRARVLVGDILTTDFGSETFDFINATEVIEHLRDPAGFFARIKELLAPGGVFSCSTGNAKGLYARVLGGRWPYVHPEGHLFYFAPDTLGRYYRRAGLDIWEPASMTPAQRRTLARAEALIAHSQLAYVKKSGEGIAGAVFRAVGALPGGLTRSAISYVVGKGQLPIAINR